MYSRIWAISALTVLATVAARPAELKPDTLAAWNQYPPIRKILK